MLSARACCGEAALREARSAASGWTSRGAGEFADPDPQPGGWYRGCIGGGQDQDLYQRHHQEPGGDHGGSGRALWFTNTGNTSGDSIGRITTAGKITNYTSADIDGPFGIAAGPDGALWFTNIEGGPDGTGGIGRITTTVTPGISSFTPTSGAAGTTVTITGQNLSGATKVAFNGTAAAIVSDTATKIVTKVPTGAATGYITVTTPAGTATSSATFTVT